MISIMLFIRKWQSKAAVSLNIRVVNWENRSPASVLWSCDQCFTFTAEACTKSSETHKQQVQMQFHMIAF